MRKTRKRSVELQVNVPRQDLANKVSSQSTGGKRLRRVTGILLFPTLQILRSFLFTDRSPFQVGVADLVIAPNAGLAAYMTWQPTIVSPRLLVFFKSGNSSLRSRTLELLQTWEFLRLCNSSVTITFKLHVIPWICLDMRS